MFYNFPCGWARTLAFQHRAKYFLECFPFIKQEFSLFYEPQLSGAFYVVGVHFSSDFVNLLLFAVPRAAYLIHFHLSLSTASSIWRAVIFPTLNETELAPVFPCRLAKSSAEGHK